MSYISYKVGIKLLPIALIFLYSVQTNTLKHSNQNIQFNLTSLSYSKGQFGLVSILGVVRKPVPNIHYHKNFSVWIAEEDFTDSFAKSFACLLII